MTVEQITFDEYLHADEAVGDENLSLRDVLNHFGITANYKGYHYTLFAVEFAVNNPESLTLVTKTLYPAIAKHYKTRWCNAERDIRTVVDIAWNENADLLEKLAQHSLPQKPKSSEFIAILAQYIFSQTQ